MAEKIMVLVPVYNEHQQLSVAWRVKNFLNPLLKWQSADPRNRQVVFVDDGSTDGTREFLEGEGFSVINSHQNGKNIGKGSAVLTGVRYFAAQLRNSAGRAAMGRLRGKRLSNQQLKAEKRNQRLANLSNATLVTLDADVQFLNHREIETLTSELRERKLDMIIAKNTEGGSSYPTHKNLVGQRAMRMDAFYPFLQSKKKAGVWVELVNGMGVDTGLNHLIRKHAFSENVEWETEAPYRRVSNPEQARQISAVEHKIFERAEVARRINQELNRTKQLRPKVSFRFDPKTLREQASMLRKLRRTKRHLR
jgi:glycosyltransferase involved in cell wall biosynthesis